MATSIGKFLVVGGIAAVVNSAILPLLHDGLRSALLGFSVVVAELAIANKCVCNCVCNDVEAVRQRAKTRRTRAT